MPLSDFWGYRVYLGFTAMAVGELMPALAQLESVLLLLIGVMAVLPKLAT